MYTPDDRKFFRNLICMQIGIGMEFIDPTRKHTLPGMDKLLNDIKNERPVDAVMSHFLENLESALPELVVFPGMGDADFEGTFVRALHILKEFYSGRDWGDPIGVHSKLNRFDLKSMSEMMKDNVSHNRRYLELNKLGRPEFLLPVVKDMFILSFEKAYYTCYKYMMTILPEDGVKKPRPIVDELLCIRDMVEVDGKNMSDVRAIRNAFSHPEAIDKYTHYELILGNRKEIFDPDRLMRYLACMSVKCAVVLGLSMILRNVALYQSLMKK